MEYTALCHACRERGRACGDRHCRGCSEPIDEGTFCSELCWMGDAPAQEERL